ncbi:MAG: C4-dicarboxylate ABC transporter permease [Rhodospirillaceae bacterium]|nr:MAG: C4-dicarboxylate ABC transporter permease [Rhodospirillaceae bacterium]
MNFLIRLAQGIDRLNDRIGRKIAWVALAMTGTQFVIVLMRYVFGANAIWMQESILYMHSVLFMLGAGYTLLHNGHVRIDIFYREVSPERKALIDLIGVFVFLIPVCVALFIMAWPYVSASWAVLEGSRETSGIQAIYLLKAVMLVFAVLLVFQGISMAIHALAVLAGRETTQLEQPRKL